MDDLFEPFEVAAIAAAVRSLKADLGDDVRIGLFGSRARRDHRPESDFDVLCLIPDGLTVNFGVVEDNVVEAMEALGGLANVQFVPESRLEYLYFEFAYLPGAIRDMVDVTGMSDSHAVPGIR